MSLSTSYEKQKQSLKQVHSSGCPYLGKHGVHPCGCLIRLSHNYLQQIDKRLNLLTCMSLFTSYEKQKHSLKRVHSSGCPYLGKHGVHPWGCPIRLSHNTVDFYIGKLRAILAAVGCQGEWESSLQLGNPASALEVKSYLKAFTAEQLQARVMDKQAVPLFLPKLHSLSRFLNRKLNSPGVYALELYILARDQAFLKALFFSSDRGSDLGKGKTLRDWASDILVFADTPTLPSAQLLL